MQISQAFSDIGGALTRALGEGPKAPVAAKQAAVPATRKAIDPEAAAGALTSGRSFPRGSFLDIRV